MQNIYIYAGMGGLKSTLWTSSASVSCFCQEASFMYAIWPWDAGEEVVCLGHFGTLPEVSDTEGRQSQTHSSEAHASWIFLSRLQEQDKNKGKQIDTKRLCGLKHTVGWFAGACKCKVVQVLKHWLLALFPNQKALTSYLMPKLDSDLAFYFYNKEKLVWLPVPPKPAKQETKKDSHVPLQTVVPGTASLNKQFPWPTWVFLGAQH